MEVGVGVGTIGVSTGVTGTLPPGARAWLVATAGALPDKPAAQPKPKNEPKPSGPPWQQQPPKRN